MASKKEKIMSAIQDTMLKIIAGKQASPKYNYNFENTVSYVDRQYLVFKPEMVIEHAKPWIIINNEGEHSIPFPGKHFENTILVDIVGFVEVVDEKLNLDTLMNSLQRDIFVAMISDETLGATAAYLNFKSALTVPEMISPFGGFVMSFEVVYTFLGVDI